MLITVCSTKRGYTANWFEFTDEHVQYTHQFRVFRLLLVNLCIQHMFTLVLVSDLWFVLSLLLLVKFSSSLELLYNKHFQYDWYQILYFHKISTNWKYLFMDYILRMFNNIRQFKKIGRRKIAALIQTHSIGRLNKYRLANLSGASCDLVPSAVMFHIEWQVKGLPTYLVHG